VLQGILVVAVRSAAMCPCGDLEQHAADLVQEFTAVGPELDGAAEHAVSEAIRGAWQGGWLPSDAPHPRQWAARNAVDRDASLRVVLWLLATLGSLPVLERLLPLHSDADRMFSG
jgi:hypothetical protein